MATVRIKSDNRFGYKIISKDNYEDRLAKGEKLELYDGDEASTVPGQEDLTDEERLEMRKEERKRKMEANRGIVDGSAPHRAKNADGTYSEPTPTDVRYPDMDKTEFANNHGAFVNKSAAQMRDEMGIEDAPGGLDPKREREVRRARNKLAEVERKGGTVENVLVKDAEEKSEDEVDEGQSEVAIPMNWRAFNATKKKALAKKITGEDYATASEAEDAINAELERRDGEVE